MEISNILSNYRLAILHDEGLVRLLALIFLEGPLSEKDLVPHTNLPQKKLREALRDLIKASAIRQFQEKFLVSDLGEKILYRIGAHETALQKALDEITPALIHKASLLACIEKSKNETRRLISTDQLRAVAFASSQIFKHKKFGESALVAAYAVSGSEYFGSEEPPYGLLMFEGHGRLSPTTTPDLETNPQSGLEDSAIGRIRYSSHQIPLVILNACRSANFTPSAKDNEELSYYWRRGETTRLKCRQVFVRPKEVSQLTQEEPDRLFLLARLWNFTVFRKDDPDLLESCHWWGEREVSDVWRSCLQAPNIWERSAAALYDRTGVAADDLRSLIAQLSAIFRERTKESGTREYSERQRSDYLWPIETDSDFSNTLQLLRMALHSLRSRSTYLEAAELAEVRSSVDAINMELSISEARLRSRFDPDSK